MCSSDNLPPVEESLSLAACYGIYKMETDCSSYSQSSMSNVGLYKQKILPSLGTYFGSTIHKELNLYLIH